MGEEDGGLGIREHRDELGLVTCFWRRILLQKYSGSSDSPKEMAWGINGGKRLSLAKVPVFAIAKDSTTTETSTLEGASEEGVRI